MNKLYQSWLQIITIIIQMKIICCAYTSSSSVSTCISYENNSSYKWCRYANTVSPGFACDASDYSTPCGGSLCYKCSSDSTYSSAINSKKLLCPTDYTYCNSQTVYLYNYGSASTLASANIPVTTLCWYKFYPYSSVIGTILMSMDSLVNATAEVFYEGTSDAYTYKGNLTNGAAMNVSVSSYNPVWVLISPTSNYAYAKITGTAYVSTTTSSSSTDLTFLFIVIPLSLLVIGVIACAITVFICRKRIKNQALALNNASIHAVISSQRPDLYDPSQHGQNRLGRNVSQEPFVSPSNLVHPAPETIEGQIYIIDPAPFPPGPEMPTNNLDYDPAYPVPKDHLDVPVGIPVYNHKSSSL